MDDGGKRPNRVAALLNRGTGAVVAAGIGPKRLVTMEVRGRRTGRRLAFPVVIADMTDGSIWWRCWALTRTGFATYVRRKARRCCGMAGASMQLWWRRRRSSGGGLRPSVGGTIRSGHAVQDRHIAAQLRRCANA
jgi:hypothetical protein